jgi:hypothetical protein
VSLYPGQGVAGVSEVCRIVMLTSVSRSWDRLSSSRSSSSEMTVMSGGPGPVLREGTYIKGEYASHPDGMILTVSESHGQASPLYPQEALRRFDID